MSNTDLQEAATDTVAFVDEYSSFVSMHHTDAAGVVYVGHPIQWAQVGMENLFRAAGHPIETLGQAPIHYPMVRLDINHWGKLRLGDPLRVRSFVSHVGNRSFTVRTQVISNDSIRVTVDMTGVAVGRDDTMPRAEDWLRELHDLAQLHGLVGTKEERS